MIKARTIKINKKRPPPAIKQARVLIKVIQLLVV
jgi:hypothetical protein